MELVTVRLRNVRSFEDVTVPFGRGVVRVTGENGAGKSTILAAVAYAVLGPESVPARKYALEKGHLELDHASKLLRRGAEWGLVEVFFRVARFPEKLFRLHRVLGERPRSRRPRGQHALDLLETEDAALVAVGADGSVQERLDQGKRTIAGAVARLLDLAPEAFAHGFQRIVAAPQGRLLQAVTEENKARREIYWKVLGVDRYAAARETASDVGAALAERYLAPLKQAAAEAARGVKELEDAPDKVTAGVVDVAAATELRDAARARRGAAHEARDLTLDAHARARERQVDGERLARELAASPRQVAEARAAVRVAETACERRAALAPARARFEALRAQEPAFEARRAEHAQVAAALEEAKRRQATLASRDSAERARVETALLDETGKLTALDARLAGLARERTELEVRRLAADEQVRTSGARARSLARWCETALPALSRLTGLARDLETGPGLERLAHAAPAADAADDLALLARGAEIEARVARAREDAGAVRGLLESWQELEGSTGENGTCPFLLEPCPHERGRNLAAVVREGVVRERARLERAEDGLGKALAEDKALRAARERVETAREAREAWRSRVGRAAPGCETAVRAFDRERERLAGSLGGGADLFFEPPAEARATLDLVARACAGIAPLPERAPADARRPATAAMPDAGWTADEVEALARAARQRLDALRTLPGSLATELDKARALAERDAGAAERRRADVTRELDRLCALVDRGPQEKAELAAARERLAREREALAARHAAEARARAVELETLGARVAALGDVPAAHEAWRSELERARRDHDEHARLEGVAAGLEAARERLAALETAAHGLAERAHALAGQAVADERAPLATPFELPPGPAAWLDPAASERLSRALADATAAARRRAEEARREEEASERELLAAESSLGVKQDRLVESVRRRDELLVRQRKLVRARAAADHVAHACSVLRGTSGEGPLAATLFKALSELPNRLADRRVRLVSTHARRIYRALAPVETWDLVWDPRTYVLALAPPGTDAAVAVRDGIAVDDMSGGQQMSAALALHLALVHTYARNCDLLFLDEPTTNLDVKRRAALAECLRTLRTRVEGLVPLRQIVVVSHDEAFDALEDHTIRVERGEAGAASSVQVVGARSPVAATAVS